MIEPEMGMSCRLCTTDDEKEYVYVLLMRRGMDSNGKLKSRP